MAPWGPRFAGGAGLCGFGSATPRRTRRGRGGRTEVTTSLQRPASRASRGSTVRELDSFEILPDHAMMPTGSSGVPRSAWQRTRRASTWHRGYALLLVALDCVAIALADFTATSTFAQSNAGFQSNHALFMVIDRKSTRLNSSHPSISYAV